MHKFLRGGHPYTRWASLPRQVWQRITPTIHTVLHAWASQPRTTQGYAALCKDKANHIRGGHPCTCWASLPRQVRQEITPVLHTVLYAWASQPRTTQGCAVRHPVFAPKKGAISQSHVIVVCAFQDMHFVLSDLVFAARTDPT